MISAKKCFISFTLIAAFAEVNSDVIRNRNQQDELPSIPQIPGPSNCMSSFPGSAQWNQCWEAFRSDMGYFQENMQHYASKLSKMMEKNIVNGKSNYAKTGGTSNIVMSGYTIQTAGLSVSISTQNDMLQIKLPIPGMEEIKSKINGNELELRIGTNENARWAKIIFPDSVKYTDLKFQRMDDGILVSGPVKNTWNPIAQHQNNWWNYMSPFPNGGFVMASTTEDPRGKQPRQTNPQMWFF